MHWHKQVIALKAQQRTLQIFDLGQKVKLKSTMMNEDVLFWKWISVDVLGLVTESAIFHWNVFDDKEPAPLKVFDRNSNLSVSASHSFWSKPADWWMLRAVKSSITVSTKMINGW